MIPPPPDRPPEPLVFSDHWLRGVVISVLVVFGLLAALIVGFKLL